jgi:hypothetical protein
MYHQSPTYNFFNKIWYKNTYNLHQVKDDELLTHYVTTGYKSNYNPSLYFNTEWYRTEYKLDENTNPLVHYTQNLNNKPNENCKKIIQRPHWRKDWVNITGDFVPLRNEKKRINLLLPSLTLSAGPQTIYIFANLLAKKGYNVRIISLYAPFEASSVRNDITKRMAFNSRIELETQYNKDVVISYDDIFIASAWWTVYPLKFILDYMNNKKFFWFIQENELLLHCGDETYAKAIECYNMDYYSFINTSILKDDLTKIGFGKFHDNNYLENECVCFEPAFDRKLFYYVPKVNRNKLKIIFYSRDATIATRNLVTMIFDLLYDAYKNGILNNTNCEVYGFGQKEGKHIICDDFFYQDLGFLDLEQYSKLFRESDILISFQMAPHPSYPPLEMAHCNGVCLHTEFSNKTNITIQRYTDKIILTEPSVHKLLDGLETCIDLVKKNKLSSAPPHLLHSNWDTALDECYKLLLNKS